MVSKDQMNEDLGIWEMAVEIQVKGAGEVVGIWEMTFRHPDTMFGGSLEP